MCTTVRQAFLSVLVLVCCGIAFAVHFAHPAISQDANAGGESSLEEYASRLVNGFAELRGRVEEQRQNDPENQDLILIQIALSGTAGARAGFPQNLSRRGALYLTNQALPAEDEALTDEQFQSAIDAIRELEQAAPKSAVPHILRCWIRLYDPSFPSDLFSRMRSDVQAALACDAVFDRELASDDYFYQWIDRNTDDGLVRAFAQSAMRRSPYEKLHSINHRVSVVANVPGGMREESGNLLVALDRLTTKVHQSAIGYLPLMQATSGLHVLIPARFIAEIQRGDLEAAKILSDRYSSLLDFKKAEDDWLSNELVIPNGYSSALATNVFWSEFAGESREPGYESGEALLKSAAISDSDEDSLLQGLQMLDRYADTMAVRGIDGLSTKSLYAEIAAQPVSANRKNGLAWYLDHADDPKALAHFLDTRMGGNSVPGTDGLLVAHVLIGYRLFDQDEADGLRNGIREAIGDNPGIVGQLFLAGDAESQVGVTTRDLDLSSVAFPSPETYGHLRLLRQLVRPDPVAAADALPASTSQVFQFPILICETLRLATSEEVGYSIDAWRERLRNAR